ncbi:MAG: hypothetical protein AAFR38_07785 [Planctomycetota bacterium]
MAAESIVSELKIIYKGARAQAAKIARGDLVGAVSGVDHALLLLNAESPPIDLGRGAAVATGPGEPPEVPVDLPRISGAWVGPNHCKRPPTGDFEFPVQHYLDSSVIVDGRVVSKESVAKVVEEFAEEIGLTRKTFRRARLAAILSGFTLAIAIPTFLIDLFGSPLNPDPVADPYPVSPPASVTATVSYDESGCVGGPYGVRESRPGLIMTERRADPVVGDVVYLSTDAPPDGWEAYAIVMTPGGDVYSSVFAEVTADGERSYDEAWMVPATEAGPMTALVVLLPSDLSEAKWNAKRDEIVPEIPSPSDAGLPAGIRLRWEGDGFDEVEVDVIDRGEVKSVRRAAGPGFRSWTGPIGDHVRDLDVPFAWSGWSFTVVPCTDREGNPLPAEGTGEDGSDGLVGDSGRSGGPAEEAEAARD